MSAKKDIQFQSEIYKLRHLVGMHYVEIPPDVIKKLGGKFNVRLLCTINNLLTFQGGIVALGNGSGYISINIKRLKQLGIKFGDTVDVSLKKDESEYGMEMPLELEELLSQDDDGKERFKALSIGKQRYIIFYVSQVKSQQLRIERALVLITNLKKLPRGKETFREMLGLEKR